MDLQDPATLGSISNKLIQPSVPRPLKTLYRGEPMALGITQILIGILEISFGLVLAITESPPTSNVQEGHIATPYWLAILVKGMLAMNVVSSVAAGIAIVILSISITHPRYYRYKCNSHYYSDMSTPDNCQGLIIIFYNLMHTISAVLLTVTVLEFFISITTAAFGCATMCRNVYSETTVVIFQKTDEGLIPASALPRQINKDVEA
ncbi:membrane-spanning 4-domains subfamily A member 4A-like isoform X3 [Sphaerodactylus townsendi]|uniref:membrane-spanning 4-domains subfamily A member 4A-like isoform X3 n=1 Tax=Sphaerodactylus townsendi TaxID=933632 RepID=UPI0020261A2A|nr:membrane-spanning 4-domains subfamily A member 4A-like isoform X3 [Sphaerodactylus townsendi]